MTFLEKNHRQELSEIETLLRRGNERTEALCRLCAIIIEICPEMNLKIRPKDLRGNKIMITDGYNWYTLSITKQLGLKIHEDTDNAFDSDNNKLMIEIAERYANAENMNVKINDFKEKLLAGKYLDARTNWKTFGLLIIYLILIILLRILLF